MATENDSAMAIAPEHLRRYLPTEIAAAISAEMREPALASYTLEAFVHLAAARYTLTTYLPRLLIHQLLEAQQATPWLIERDGSLLFADLSGSTALAERLSALGREGTERVTDALNHIFSTLITIIEHYGGDLLTFGGDALLVFFSGEGHTSAAAQAALALQAAMDGYTHEISGVGSFPMHVHIGVESGPVAFASVGLAHAQYCFPLGATVNRVAIAETLAPPGQIVLGPNTAAALASAEGQPLEHGFMRLAALHGPQPAFAPLAEQAPITAAPEQAIPVLLDELHRFSPYIQPQLLEKVLADPQRPEIEAELRPVTVLFAQVLGLEDVLATFTPAAAAEAIQTYIAAMQEAVERYGGDINKIDVAEEGVKLVAIFGAPTAYEDHAERAALAAIEMQARVGKSSDWGRGRHGATQGAKSDTPLLPRPLQRIGLNLGTAFAGNVGSLSRKEYTVMGDAVNVAARVMSRAEWGEIWCAAAVSDATAARLVCAERGAVALKGKAQPLELCRVIAARETAPAELMPADGPLIGRERELIWLRERLAAAKLGQGCTMQIIGDAGVGKSRLTAALVADAHAAGFRVIAAACFSYTVGIPYAAWSEWLKACCGIVSGDSNAQRIHKLGAALAQLGPEMAEWLPILGDLVRLDTAENRLTRGLDPKMRQARRFELLEQLLLQAASETPVLALFEDMHWADPISLELWQRVAAKLEGTKVLLLGVHRPGLELNNLATTQLLRLRELSADESSAMIAALTGAAALPESMLQQIITRAGGNPLFLNELMHAVVSRSQGPEARGQAGNPALQGRESETSPALQGQESAASLDASPQPPAPSVIADLPDSLSGLLLARIDRLDETSRNVLRIASVIGQRIPFGVLRALQPQEQEALVRQLLRLDEQELTALERIEPERVHVFRHALIQEVAYQSMLYARRRDLHGRIGAYLERRYAGDLDDYIGLIAHHYRLSDRREKAITYLLQAGEAASAVYANAEAIQSLEWAIAAIDDDSDLRMWHAREVLADVFSTIGRYEDARAQHSAIIAAPAASAEAQQRAYRKRGTVHEKQGQYAAALADLDQAMAIATADDARISPLAVPAICAEMGFVHQRLGAYDQAISTCEAGLRDIDRDPRTREDEQIESQLHSILGGTYGMRGDYPRSRYHFEHSLRIREMIDDLPGIIAANNNLGYLWQLEGDYHRALEKYSVAESLAEKIGLHTASIFSGLNKAYAFIHLSHYQNAIERCKNVLKIAASVKDLANAAQSYTTLGIAYFHTGDYHEALEMYSNALALNYQLESSYQIANVQMNKAAVLNALYQYGEAQILGQEALDKAELLQAQRLRIESLNVLAEAQLGLGDYAMAKQLNDAACTAAEKVASRQDLGIALRIQGCIRAALGQPFAQSFAVSLQLFGEIAEQFERGRTAHTYGAALLAQGEKSHALALLKQAETTFNSIGAHGELRKLAERLARSS